MDDLTRTEVEAWAGDAVLEFGTSWCPICEQARPMIDSVLSEHEGLRHVWVEDGRGKPLGRHFGVKLWPTVVVLRDGKEVARVVRPQSEDDVRRALDSVEE